MVLAGFAPVAMNMTALALNLAVAGIGTALFLRAGRIGWRNIWPYATLGFPFSMLGSAVHLPERLYFPIVGAVPLLSAFQMVLTAWRGRLVKLTQRWSAVAIFPTDGCGAFSRFCCLDLV